LTVDCTPLAGGGPPLAGLPVRNRAHPRIVEWTRRTRPGLQKGGAAQAMAMATLDKWLTRLAIVGAAAGLIAGALFWLVLTRPVALAALLDRIL